MNTIPETHALWSLFWPLLLALPRISAAATVAPLFPASLFPMLLRQTVVVSLSVCVYPRMAADAPVDLAPLAWLALVGKELLVGALIGLAVGTLVWVFESVGAAIDMQTGMSTSLIFDPFGGHEGGPTGALMARLAVILFVLGGGLYVFVSLLLESFVLWPVASFHPVIDARLADFGADSLGSLTELVVRLAAPVVLLLVLVDLGFGLVNRVVPQLNVFYFTMPLKGAIAALMIALYLSYLADVAAAQIAELSTLLERLAPVLFAG